MVLKELKTFQIGDMMRKQNKGILYGSIYFLIMTLTICVSLIIFAFGVHLDFLPLMIIPSLIIFLVSFFQSITIRDYVIYKKYGVKP